MIFLCNDIPEICTNMCYGAYCLDIGESLTYDKPSASEKRKRRKAAGCIESGGNRCSTRKGHDPGFNCDEYPFASTVSDGGASDRVNRCVPVQQNSKQGGIINKFYQSAYCGGGPCDFTVSFGNPGSAGVTYCDAWADPEVCDVDDDNEVIGPGTAGGDPTDDDIAGDGTDLVILLPGEEEPSHRKMIKKSKKSRIMGTKDTTVTKKRNGGSKKGMGRYRTASGMIVDVPGGAHIGQRAFHVVPKNATLWEEQAGVPLGDRELDPWLGGYGDMVENLELREDTVVEEIFGPSSNVTIA